MFMYASVKNFIYNIQVQINIERNWNESHKWQYNYSHHILKDEEEISTRWLEKNRRLSIFLSGFETLFL